MKNLIDTFFRHDFMIHFFFGFFIFAAFNIFYQPYIALLITAIMGFGKEVVWDGLLEKGQFDSRDILYTWLPGTVWVIVEQIQF